MAMTEIEIQDATTNEMDEVPEPLTQGASVAARKAEKTMFLFRVFMAELLVTFMFLFTVMALGVNNARDKKSVSGIEPAIVTGFCAVAMIYSFADVSGAHFNPAVTFATMVTRKTSIKKGLCYIGAQLLASILATFWVGVLFGFDEIDALNVQPWQGSNSTDDTGNTIKAASVFQAFLMETTLTFILCYVIFATAFSNIDTDNIELNKVLADKKIASVKTKDLTIYNVSGNSKAGFAGLAIGFTLGFLTMIGGNVSGGAFNPARVFGPAICTGFIFREGYVWLYWVGDFAGAAAAGVLQHFFNTVQRFEKEGHVTTREVLKSFVPRELEQFTNLGK
jgi:glycerol uptake facilitator-like aquaporin